MKRRSLSPRRTRIGARVVLVVLAALLGGSPFASSAACRRDDVPSVLGADGSFGVGVRTLDLRDATRATPAHGAVPAQDGRRLVTEVWYPIVPSADQVTSSSTPLRDAPVAHGRFPLIVDAHGFLDVREGRAYYAIALARRGYVVAAPDFPVANGRVADPSSVDLANNPGDISFVISTLLDFDRDPTSPLRSHVARKRIAVSGLSNGGGIALLAGFHRRMRDRRIRAVAAIAPAACYLGTDFYAHARPRLLIVEGSDDILAPSAQHSRLAFERARRSERWLVTLARGTHVAFAGLITFPSMTSYDAIGCASIGSIPLERLVLDLESLGGAAAGIETSACRLTCTHPLPAGPPMQALRQHELTIDALTAFFDATLKRSRGARCVLNRELAARNADLTVVHARGGAGS